MMRALPALCLAYSDKREGGGLTSFSVKQKPSLAPANVTEKYK